MTSTTSDVTSPSDGLCGCGCGERTRISPQTKTSRGEVKGQPQRFVRGHFARIQNGTPAQRFEARYSVEDAGHTSPCWLWTGPVTRKGYATLPRGGANRLAHRFAFERDHGPIPDGQQLDHLCRNRRCVNPAHLEAVTPGVNARRGTDLVTSCPAGHPYNEANTYVVPSTGARYCRQCGRESDARWRARRRGEDVPLRPKGKPRTWRPENER